MIDALLAETDRLRAAVTAGPSETAVPACPGWTIAELARHVADLQHWATHIVTTRRTERLWPHELDAPAPAGAPDAWLATGAEAFARAAREAGPDTPVWSWGPDHHVRWWTRRLLFETLVHRTDASLAFGVRPDIDPAIAADGIEEFLTNVPHARWVTRNLRTLDRPGETVHLAATDTGAEWTLTLTGEAFTWAAGPAAATVTARGPVADLLLTLYGRPTAGRVTRTGDTALLTRFLELAAL